MLSCLWVHRMMLLSQILGFFVNMSSLSLWSGNSTSPIMDLRPEYLDKDEVLELRYTGVRQSSKYRSQSAYSSFFRYVTLSVSFFPSNHILPADNLILHSAGDRIRRENPRRENPRRRHSRIAATLYSKLNKKGKIN